MDGKWKEFAGKDITHAVARESSEYNLLDYKNLNKEEKKKADLFIRNEILPFNHRIVGKLITETKKKA